MNVIALELFLLATLSSGFFYFLQEWIIDFILLLLLETVV